MLDPVDLCRMLYFYSHTNVLCFLAVLSIFKQNNFRCKMSKCQF